LLKVIVTPDIAALLPVLTLPEIDTPAGAAAWVTVTSFGLPLAPFAVTRMVPVRDVVLVLTVYAQVMVPEFVPPAPDVMDSQLLPDVTAAVQDMVPEPVLDTLNVVVPLSLATLGLWGAT
jgi:hypothetical protein